MGRQAIYELYERFFADAPHFEPETPLPTLRSGDLELTTTPPKDGGGTRAQVVQRRPDGSWLRLLDYPELGRITGKSLCQEPSMGQSALAQSHLDWQGLRLR